MGATLLLLITALLASGASGTVLQVPLEYSTIRQAMNASVPGDTILIDRGIYVEYLQIPGHELTLMSHFVLTGDSADLTETVLSRDLELDPDTSSVMTILETETDLKLIGLTVRDGQGVLIDSLNQRRGGAIYQLGGSLTLRHCVVTENNAILGLAIWSESSNLTIDDCDIHHNGEVAVNQGTIRSDMTALVIRRTRFHHNVARGASAILGLYGSLLMDSCVVDSNRNFHATLAHVAFRDGPATVTNCEFNANAGDTTSIGARSLHLQDGSFVVNNCSFVGNICRGTTCLSLTGGTLEMTDCRFERNRASFSQIVSVFGGAEATFLRCEFLENSAYNWSCLGGQGNWTLERCVFRDNVSDSEYAGAIISSTSLYSGSADNCIFEGNLPCAVSDADDEHHLQHFENCWWGHESGPYHATLNPLGQGDVIRGDSISFIPWLTEPPLPVDEWPVPVPRLTGLLTAYPNPFNASVTFRFDALPRPRKVMLVNLLGQQVDEIHVGPHLQTIQWTPDGLASGAYFATLESATVKLSYIR